MTVVRISGRWFTTVHPGRRYTTPDGGTLDTVVLKTLVNHRTDPQNTGELPKTMVISCKTVVRHDPTIAALSQAYETLVPVQGSHKSAVDAISLIAITHTPTARPHRRLATVTPPGRLPDS